jgi:phenylacetate-CoA ligase
MPVVLQNAAFSLLGLKQRRFRYGGAFKELLAWLEEAQWADPDDIRRYQDEQVRDFVRHAYESVPFYRDLYDRHGVGPDDVEGIGDLPKLPIVTRSMVREAGEGLRSDRFRRRDLIVSLTSGTTGTPLRVCRTRYSWAFQWAVWWRHRARFGMTIDDPFLMVGARVPIPADRTEPPFWRRDWANHRVYLSAYHLKPENMPAIVDMLQRERFRFYTGYPSAIAQIGDYLVDHAIELQGGPEVVITGSDALLPRFARRIREALHAPVTDQYGMLEFAGNFAQCEHGNYHLDYECGHAELLPMEGTDRRNLVLTGWGNRAMPFIRYEVGDHAVLPASQAPCACGRHTWYIARVDGRLEDYVYTPDGRKIIGMNQVFEYAVGTRKMQIRQDAVDRIEVRIVPAPDYDDAATRAAVGRELQRRLGDVPMDIEYTLVDDIPPEANGKFRAVVSTVTDTSAAGRAVREALADDGTDPAQRDSQDHEPS